MAKKVKFNFNRTTSYRIFHVDGAFGGWTPRSMLYIDLYVEHQIAPLSHTIQFDEETGEPVQDNPDSLEQPNEANDDFRMFDRDIECGLVMSAQGAVALRDWLTSKIDENNERNSKLKEDE